MNLLYTNDSRGGDVSTHSNHPQHQQNHGSALVRTVRRHPFVSLAVVVVLCLMLPTLLTIFIHTVLIPLILVLGMVAGLVWVFKKATGLGKNGGPH